MYRRLVILTIIIVAALSALSVLGHHAVAKWAQGLEGVRLGEFAEVAEHIREDVKRKLDEFMAVEQQRKYTDYLYYYVPDNIVTTPEQLPLLRSPLSEEFSNGFAHGYFQVEPGGRVVTPYAQGRQTPAGIQDEELDKQVQQIESNVKLNVLPSVTTPSGALTVREAAAQTSRRNAGLETAQMADGKEAPALDGSQSKGKAARGANYDIGSLWQNVDRPQIFTQQRSVAVSNQAQVVLPEHQRQEAMPRADRAMRARDVQAQRTELPGPDHQQAAASQPFASAQSVPQAQPLDLSDTVQIRIEPFVPIVVPGDGNESSVFGGQVFLLRHVQIEDSHLLQGFQLDEAKLVEEVEESATRFVREGMAFGLPQIRPNHNHEKTAYTAILDFGFGDLVLTLKEVDPGWITKRIAGLQRVYIGIIVIVAVAVALALASLWHNVRAQAQLAQKKDDFISAVSHELRTPLTSIRMYSEMLEKGWVKSTEKLSEYYRSMRQESERLSRLVDNVLDFSRIQKGRKEYAFHLGDVNACVTEVVAMMRPYAERHGFAIETDLAALAEMPFDRDAVTQIVVNLIDNAVKYADAAQDKTVLVRTGREGRFTVIEVEDHGPGIPHRQRKKVFEQFYRYDAEPQQHHTQTTGTGLGLALVKRFAQAHDGFVEVRSAQPSGVTLRVALAAHS
jgi:signal transduction histidine kinase